MTDLKIKTDSAGMRVTQLTVETSVERLQQTMERTARRIAREVKIPGFRKGKAPYGVIVQRYGEETILQEAMDELAETVYREAVEIEEITPYAPASLIEAEPSPPRFVFTIPLPPVVDLKKYRSMRVKVPKIRVDKKEIAEALESLRQQHAVLELLEGRGAQEGDVLALTVKGQNEEGKVFLDDDEAEILLDFEEEYPAPGFHKALEGIKPEEERTFHLEMPEGSAFKEAEFTARLVKLQKRVLPELDDDLARTVGSFDSLKELREDVKEKITQQKEQEAERAYADTVIDTLIERAKVEYPPDAVEDMINRLLEQFGQRVQQEARMSLPDYLTAVGKEEDELREEFREQAEEQLRRSLVLFQVIEEEDIQVEDEEMKERINGLSESWGDQAELMRQQLEDPENRRIVMNDLLMDKTVERLVAIARGEIKEK